MRPEGPTVAILARSSRRGADLLEAVEDQVEPELERAHFAVRALAEVLLGVLVEVRKRVDGDCLRELLLEVRDLFCGVGVTRLPEREAEDMAVEDVVGVVRRLGGESGFAQPSEEQVRVSESCRADAAGRQQQRARPGVPAESFVHRDRARTYRRVP